MGFNDADKTSTGSGSVTIAACRAGALFVVGYALFQGWADILFISEVVSLPVVSPDIHQIYILFRTVGFFACFAVSRKMPSLSEKQAAHITAAALMAAGSCLMIASAAFPFAALGFQTCGAAFGGMGAGLFTVVWFEALVSLGPVPALMCFLVSALVAPSLISPLYALPFEAHAFWAIALPLLAFLLVRLGVSFPPTRDIDPDATFDRSLFVRSVALLALFGFALAFREPMLGNDPFASGSYTAVGSLIVAVVVFAGVAIGGSKFHISFVCRILLPLTAVVFLLMPMHVPLLDVASDTSGAASDELVKILALYVFACLCWANRASVVRLFGFAYGIHGVLVFLGRATYFALTTQGVSETDIAAKFGIIAAIIIAATIFILPSSQELDPLDLDREIASRSGGLEPSKDRDVAGVVDALARRYSLTARETEVLALVLEGKTVDDIATELVIARETAKTHRRNVFVKCEVHQADELWEAAQRP